MKQIFYFQNYRNNDRKAMKKTFESLKNLFNVLFAAPLHKSDFPD